MKLSEVKPMKTAIVGCGAISDIFFKNFTERFSIIDLVKCCSRNGASAEAKAAQYNIEASTLEEILADPEIELVVNLTPASQHYDIIKSALEAGKHVFTEKVITPDFRTTQELIDLAEEKGLILCSEPDHFMGSSWQTAREYVDGGIIGEVTSITASVSNNVGAQADYLRFVNDVAGGVAYDFGIYLVTQFVSLLGPVDEVCGVMMTQRPDRVHREVKTRGFGEEYEFISQDIASATLKFKNGAIGVLHLNGNSVLEAPQRFMVYGTQGALSLPLGATFSGDMALYRPGSFAPQPLITAHAFDHDSRGVGCAEMAWSIRLGRKPRAYADLGLHCLEVLQGIEESCKTKSFYKMTTSCERPEPLPKGYRGIPTLSNSEEGSLVFI